MKESKWLGVETGKGEKAVKGCDSQEKTISSCQHVRKGWRLAQRRQRGKIIFFLFSTLLRIFLMNIRPNNLLPIYETVSQNVFRISWNIRECLIIFTKINDTKGMKCFFWDMVTYNVEGVYSRFGGTHFHHLQGRRFPTWRWIQHFPPKHHVHSSQTTRLHISNLIFTTVKTSDLAFHIYYLFFVNIIV